MPRTLVKPSIATSTQSGLVSPRFPQRDLTFTSTPAGWVLTRAVGLAYADSSGNWRLRFNIFATTTTNTTLNTTIVGVIFKNVPAYAQSITSITAGSSIATRAYTNSNSGTITVQHATTNNGFIVSGDVELEGAPSW